MRQGPVPASGGTGRGRRELALSPSLAGRAARRPARRSRRGATGSRSLRGAARAPGSRPDCADTWARRPVAAGERPPSIRPHDEPSRSGCRPLPRNDRQATDVFGRLGHGHHGLLAPGRRSRSGRCRAASERLPEAEARAARHAARAPQAAAAPEAATRRGRAREPRPGGARAGTRAGRGSPPRRRCAARRGARAARASTASELSPTAPTRAPSPTSSPRCTAIEPSCNSVTE